MPKPNARDLELARSAIDGEGLGPAVLDRIERAIDQAREEAIGQTAARFLLLVQERDELIRELEFELAAEGEFDLDCIERDERVAELESKLSRWGPTVRAAVQWTTAEKDFDASADGEQEIAAKKALWDAEEAIHAAVGTITPEERERILKEDQ